MAVIKSFVITLIFTWFTIGVFAQRIGYNWGGTDAKNYYEEIPYEAVNGKIFLQVGVNGRKARFLFDTGAPTQLIPALAKELNSKQLATDYINDVNNAKDSVAVVLLKEIQLGNTKFTGLHVPVITSAMYKCFNIEGVIGSNMLRNSIVRIDPVKHLIIITDDVKKFALYEENAIKMVSNMGPQSYPLLITKFNGKKMPLLGFDTGDSEFLSMSDKFRKYLAEDNLYKQLASGFGGVSIGVFGLAKSDTCNRIKIPSIQIGNHIFNNAICETSKFASTRFGSKILDYGAVTLDFKHHKFYFEAINQNFDLSEKQWPIGFSVVDDKLVITIAWNELSNSLQAGDQILKIDNVDYPQADLCERLNGKPLLDGKEKALLTIKDLKGQTKTVEIFKN